MQIFRRSARRRGSDLPIIVVVLYLALNPLHKPKGCTKNSVGWEPTEFGTGPWARGRALNPSHISSWQCFTYPRLRCFTIRNPDHDT